MEKNNINKTFCNTITPSEELEFQIYCGCLSILSTIPNIISIITILFLKEKKSLQKQIQLLLCFSFIGIEIRFYPIIGVNKQYYILQNSISYSFIIIANYYQFIHSFIAYKLFTSPEKLYKGCIILFIYVLPFLLFLVLFFFINHNFDLIIYFNFIAYENDPNSQIQYSKIISGILRSLFFILNIFYIIKLKNQIRNLIKITKSIDIKFAKNKFIIYKKKLIQYIIVMIFVAHPYLIRYIILKFFNVSNDPNNLLCDYIFAHYFHGVECISALLFWSVYIYHKNFLGRFLIIFCCKKESEFLNDFLEEKKYYEESAKSILISNQDPNISMLNIANDINDKKIYPKNEANEVIAESLTEDETL